MTGRATASGSAILALALAGLAGAYVPALLCGLPAVPTLKMLGMALVLWGGTGLLAVRVLLGDAVPAWMRIAAGLAAGPFIAGLVLAAGARIGAPWLHEALLLPAGVAGVGLAVRDFLREPFAVPRGPALAVAGLWLAMVIAILPESARDGMATADGGRRVGYIDTPWHATVAALSRDAIPPPTPSNPARALQYHAFPHYLLARLGVFSGMPAEHAFHRFGRPLMLWMIAVGIVAWAAGALPRHRWTAPLALLLVAFAGGPHDPFYGIYTALKLAGGEADSLIPNPANGNGDRTHLAVGSSGVFFFLLLPLLLTLLRVAATEPRRALRPLLLASVLLSCCCGFSSLFALTASLAGAPLILAAAFAWRRPRLLIPLGVLLAGCAAVRALTGSVPVPIGTRLGDWPALWSRVSETLALAGLGWGVRSLWILHVIRRGGWRRGRWLEAGFCTAGMAGWMAGFMVLDVPGADLHFPVYATGVASLLSAAWLARTLPIWWRGRSVRGGARSLGIVAACWLPGLAALGGKLPLVLAATVAWLAACAALFQYRRLARAARGLARPHAGSGLRVRRLALVLLVASCATSGLDLYARLAIGRLGYRVPADLVRACEWIRDTTPRGQPFFSLVRSIPGAPRADERCFAIQAIAERPAAGDATQFMGVTYTPEFRRVRAALDDVLAGRVPREPLGATVPGARMLLLRREDIGRANRALGSPPVLFEKGDYAVVGVAQ